MEPEASHFTGKPLGMVRWQGFDGEPVRKRESGLTGHSPCCHLLSFSSRLWSLHPSEEL